MNIDRKSLESLAAAIESGVTTPLQLLGWLGDEAAIIDGFLVLDTRAWKVGVEEFEHSPHEQWRPVSTHDSGLAAAQWYAVNGDWYGRPTITIRAWRTGVNEDGAIGYFDDVVLVASQYEVRRVVKGLENEAWANREADRIYPNVKKLRGIVEWVEAEQAKKGRGEPSEWDQTVWLFGTTCCVAGKVVLDRYGDDIEIDQSFPHFRLRSDENQIRMNIPKVAQQLLGISNDDAELLCYTYTRNGNAADIRRICERIAGRRL